jgi:Cytochrome c554 and c-prime
MLHTRIAMALVLILILGLSGPSGPEYRSDRPPVNDYWRLPIPFQGDVPADHLATAGDLSASACAQCHPAQYEAWRGSRHCRATSAGFLGQLGALDYEERRHCLRCHAPRSEQQEAWENVELSVPYDLGGVDCASCHVREHQRYGPRAVAPTPHGPVQKLALFRESEFCAPCHQFGEEGLSVYGKPLENTYAEWLASRYVKEGQSCQSCHIKDGRHAFAGIHDPDMTRTGLELAADRIAAGVRLRLWNAGAGHALPTYITPRIRVLLYDPARDAVPVREYAIQRRMSWDIDSGWRELSDTRLLPDQAVELAHTLATDQAMIISIIVDPDADYHERIYPALLELLADQLTPSERSLLENARAESGRSSYVLYCVECGPWRGVDAPCARRPPTFAACSMHR